MERKIAGLSIECVLGDIAAQEDMAAVVNAANAQLRPGGGVAGAIHRAAGPGLDQECRQWAPISPGQAVITKGHNLPNKNVIHCLGPVYGVDKPEHKLLAACYKNALQLAEEQQLDSVAFPAISSGAFGYPLQQAAEVALQAIMEAAPKLQQVQKVSFVLHSKNDLMVFQKVLQELHQEK